MSHASAAAQVFVHMEQGLPTEFAIYNARCPVDARGQTVTWVEAVPSAAGFEWLSEQIDAGAEDVWQGALVAVAMHADDRSPDRLYQIAIGDPGDRGQQAVFWLGESRGEQGFQRLARLLDELPVGERRERINFALSHSDTAAAGDLLYQISQTDADEGQRADALFWLSQDKDPRALAALQHALESDTSEEVAQRALLALTELESVAAADVLVAASRHHRLEEIRGQALFWLARAYPRRAEPVITARLAQSVQEDEMEQAVFALSQLPDAMATSALLNLIRGEYPRSVRKKALFWLSESEDPAAIAALDALLRLD